MATENAVTFEHGKLLAGEAHYIFSAAAAAGTYKIGDVLKLTTGSGTATWGKATAVTAADLCAVCNEDVTLTGAGVVVCIKEGFFNANVIKVNDLAVDAATKEILAGKNIFVETVLK